MKRHLSTVTRCLLVIGAVLAPAAMASAQTLTDLSDTAQVTTAINSYTTPVVSAGLGIWATYFGAALLIGIAVAGVSRIFKRKRA
jgi:hypothetical protein